MKFIVTESQLKKIISEETSKSFDGFASKRFGGAEKIVNNAKEKGGVSMLTYHHFKVKLPYYKKASEGKFNLEESKKEYKELLKKLYQSTKGEMNIEQVEFQKLVGLIEVLGELIIKEESSKSELINESVKYSPSYWNSNAEVIYNRLKQHRLPEKSIAAVMGNLFVESGFKPTAVGDTKLKGGTSVGIAQWRESRKQALIKFANKKGKSPNDISTQVDYLMHEINNQSFYSETKRALFNPNLSASDTAAVFTKNFERPANASMEGKKRGAIATQMIINHKNNFINALKNIYGVKR